MRDVTRALVAFFCATWGTHTVAQQHAPNARIVNLGTNTIDAYHLANMPFRMVALDAQPGDTLSPGYYTGALKFEIYWRLQNGEVHSATVDLEKILPSPFDGNIVVTIHDDHINVSWAKIAEEWVEYSRIGNPSKFARPETSYFAGCAGVILDNPITSAAWRRRADELRQRAPGGSEVELKIAESRCALGWYIPTAAPGRAHPQLDEKTMQRLREEWMRQIELYKRDHDVATDR